MTATPTISKSNETHLPHGQDSTQHQDAEDGSCQNLQLVGDLECCRIQVADCHIFEASFGLCKSRLESLASSSHLRRLMLSGIERWSPWMCLGECHLSFRINAFQLDLV